MLGYNAVAALRQHIRPEERIHGIFTEAGVKPNIVPSRAVAEWYVRSGNMSSLETLKERVQRCLQGGADAAGCEMHAEWLDPPFFDMIDNHPLLDRYVQNAIEVGRHPVPEQEGAMVVGSTDMGNVSYAVPSIHPMVKAAPEGTAIHTPDFEVFAGGEEGDRAVTDGALTLALTMVDCLASDDLRRDIADEFNPPPSPIPRS